MNEHERAFVMAFILPARRERYLDGLASPKRRRKILDKLNHRIDLAASCVAELPASTWNKLAANSDKTCHLIADASDMDGKDVTFNEGMEFLQEHPFGAVLSCVPGRIAFYKAESPAPILALVK